MGKPNVYLFHYSFCPAKYKADQDNTSNLSIRVYCVCFLGAESPRAAAANLSSCSQHGRISALEQQNLNEELTT